MRTSSPILQGAIEAHKDFSKQLAALFQMANGGQGANAALKARALGKQYGVFFRGITQKMSVVTVPQQATRPNEYLTRWLSCLTNACDTLANAPDDGRDTTYLRDTHDFLDDARYAAKALTELRQRLHEAIAAPAKPGSGAGQGSRPA